MVGIIIAFTPYVFAASTAVAGATFIIKYGTGQVADSVKFLMEACMAVLKFTCGMTLGQLLGFFLASYLTNSHRTASSGQPI
jgi:hypothetical protein